MTNFALPSRRRIGAPVLVVGLVALIVSAVLLWRWTRDARDWQEVETRSVQRVIRATGSVEPAAPQLLTTLHGGTVREIHVRAGGEVDASEALITLSNPTLEAEALAAATSCAQAQRNETLERLEGRRNVAEAELNHARGQSRVSALADELKVLDDLVASALVSRLQHAQKRSELALAKAETQSWGERARIEQAISTDRVRLAVDERSSACEGAERVRRAVDDLAIKAPSAMTIIDVPVKPGESLAAGAAVLEYYDGSKVIRVRWLEADAELVTPGREVTVTGLSETLRIGDVDPVLEEGMVQSIVPVGTDRRLGGTVELELRDPKPHPAATVRSGPAAGVHAALRKRDGVTTPLTIRVESTPGAVIVIGDVQPGDLLAFDP